MLPSIIYWIRSRPDPRRPTLSSNDTRTRSPFTRRRRESVLSFTIPSAGLFEFPRCKSTFAYSFTRPNPASTNPEATTSAVCRNFTTLLAIGLEQTVSADDVKTHGRWSPLSGTFEKFYRLNRNSAINLSSVILASSGSTAFVSGRHNGE